MTFPDPWTVLLVGTVALLVAGALAPLETLGWWAGWFGEEGGRDPDPDVPKNDAACYVVFLSGIHTVSGVSFARRERVLLDRLMTELRDAEILEVFPYSVTDRPLTGQRTFARFWRWALARKLSKRQLAGLAGMLINIRNGWQVAVSADRRYGPMYDAGSADLLAQRLRSAGYRPGSGVPVVLIGYSGGGQIALGAARPLATRLGVSPTVLSLGGVMASPRTLEGLHRVVHARGRRDAVARLSTIAFPGRWPFVRWSSWNRAKRSGLVTVADMGPMDHTGRDGYMDAERHLRDGRSYLDATVDLIASVVEGEEPRGTAARARAAPHPS
ncbi:MAG: hypothetical protein U5K81_05290 [Trueperaceae bacterium]|nr:hypothetical protein [Trueperaceae bacterium]